MSPIRAAVPPPPARVVGLFVYGLASLRSPVGCPAATNGKVLVAAPFGVLARSRTRFAEVLVRIRDHPSRSVIRPGVENLDHLVIPLVA